VTARAAAGGPIFLDHSGHALTNLGDVAMLQAAVSRLAARFPGREVRVPTSAPDRLARFCPEASALPSEGLRALAGLGYLPFRHRLPRRMAAGAARLEARLRGRRPEWLDGLALRRGAPGSAERGAAGEILDALGRSALFVAGGGGYLTDAFPEKAWSALTLLRRAQRRGIPTALVSQGVGPLEEPALRALASRVLADVDCVALREGRTGPALLALLGVDPRRVVVTGDDAVEAARSAPRRSEAAAIGVNLRSASYAGLDGDASARLGAALRRLGAELAATLVPIPIALDDAGPDAEAVRRAIGETGPAEAEPSDPAGAIARASRCRVVVTASYHAAVFALAQGIPAVGVSRTRYYDGKLEGLADLFGSGARVVRLDEGGWEEELASAVRGLWAEAPALRAGLAAAAADQVRRQHDAYDRIAALAGGSAAARRDTAEDRRATASEASA
jgi:polysaccharide pyruvyl transferase WcaK-like protein